LLLDAATFVFSSALAWVWVCLSPAHGGAACTAGPAHLAEIAAKVRLVLGEAANVDAI
jgi:hypothetical protein